MQLKSIDEPELDIDPDRIEQHIEEKVIGERIRHLRLKRSMGLVELGRLTGLSASFLSQLETGRVIPTLRNLARIALVFGKDLSFFFEPAKRVVFRRLNKKDRIPVTRKLKQNARFVSESMSSLVTDGRMVPCLAEFLPQGDACEFTPKVFQGVEMLYLIEGTLDLALGSQRHYLEAGDVVWIDASTPRQYLCNGDRRARSIIITQHTR